MIRCNIVLRICKNFKKNVFLTPVGYSLGYYISLHLIGMTKRALGIDLFDGPYFVWNSNNASQPFNFRYNGSFQQKLSFSKSGGVLERKEYFRVDFRSIILETTEYLLSFNVPNTTFIVNTQERGNVIPKLIYYKQWKFSSTMAVNLSLVRKHTRMSNEFNDLCDYGGFVIVENVTYGKRNKHKTFAYGPYCKQTLGEPLVNIINSWVFPEGSDYFIVFSYGKMFQLNAMVVLTSTPCIGITNICIR